MPCVGSGQLPTMFVLVGMRWWLEAGQVTPIKPEDYEGEGGFVHGECPSCGHTYPMNPKSRKLRRHQSDGCMPNMYRPGCKRKQTRIGPDRFVIAEIAPGLALTSESVS